MTQNLQMIEDASHNVAMIKKYINLCADLRSALAATDLEFEK